MAGTRVNINRRRVDPVQRVPTFVGECGEKGLAK